jgi:hypothetical protein
MKCTVITSLLIVTVACVLAGCTPTADAPPSVPGAEQQAASPGGDIETRANALVDSLSREDFAAVVGHFDATMKAVLPEAALKQTWTGLTQQAGPFKSRGKSRVTSEMGYTVVYVECAFERANLNAKVVYNTSGEVSGLFLTKA